MAYYRLYFRDRFGSFLRAEEVTVDTDDEALARARALDHAFSVEVWQQDRQVGIVHPGDNGEPGAAAPAPDVHVAPVPRQGRRDGGD